MEVKPGTNLGSYHVIDGQKMTVRYPGQQQTCARCFQTPQHCKGKGIARICEVEQGPKVEFTDHILALWKRIGYSPDCTDLPEVASLEPDDPGVQSTGVKQQDGGSFTPHKGPVPDIAKYTGVSVKQFPKDLDHGRVVEFLVASGIPEN